MKVAVFLANGFEEVEAITIIDVLRRANIETLIVGIDADLAIGAHNIGIRTDLAIEALGLESIDMIVLPGGIDGTNTLAKDTRVQDAIKTLAQDGKKIGAICAAPQALNAAGVLSQRYTCYPGCDEAIKDHTYTGDEITKEKNIITSKGPATAMSFALEIVRDLMGEQAYQATKDGLLA